MILSDIKDNTIKALIPIAMIVKQPHYINYRNGEISMLLSWTVGGSEWQQRLTITDINTKAIKCW